MTQGRHSCPYLDAWIRQVSCNKSTRYWVAFSYFMGITLFALGVIIAANLPCTNSINHIIWCTATICAFGSSCFYFTLCHTNCPMSVVGYGLHWFNIKVIYPLLMLFDELLLGWALKLEVILI